VGQEAGHFQGTLNVRPQQQVGLFLQRPGDVTIQQIDMLLQTLLPGHHVRQRQ